MEGTRGGSESARKIFEMGATRRQRNASEGRVQEKALKAKWMEGKSQGTHGILERKEKEQGEEGKRELLPEELV
jgi:hypothetical protein